MADALFNQADVNQDQRLDLDEFRNLLAQNLGVTAGAGSFDSSSSAAFMNGQFSAGSFGTSSSAAFAGGNFGETNAVSDGANFSSYDQSSFASANSGDVSGFSTEGFQTGVDLSAQSIGIASSSSFEASASQQQVQVNASNPQNLFQDPNPQIIRRPAQGGAVTYTQNIRVRFLQPPPIPPPGPLIIKEVRPPQPPPPPPLRIRQQAPPLPQPPPLVLRERPPQPPAAVASQTVIRKLAALPVPPRSIIIERLPAAPPKPRDIIIERWLPYKAHGKRKTIVQRAASAKQYAKPRNIIIQYEPVQVRVIRQFQRLGVTQENPIAYIQRYGATLLNAQTLVQQARAAGVVEDISPPNVTTAVESSSSTSFNGQFSKSIADVEAGNVFGSSSSSFESANFGSNQQMNAGYSGVESTEGIGVTSDFSSSYDASQGATIAEGFSGSFDSNQNVGLENNVSSSFETNSFSSQGVSDSGFSSGVVLNGNASGFAGFSTSTVDFNNGDSDPAIAAFRAADLNKDGALDANEFRQFLSGQLRLQ